MKAEQTKVFSHRGSNVTLPCKFYRDHASSDSGSHKIRVKWTKLTSDYLKEVDVYVEMGYHKKSYGNYQNRVFLQKSTENDASLVITNIMLEDYGKYKCEVIEGLEDDTAVVSLDLDGKYSQPKLFSISTGVASMVEDSLVLCLITNISTRVVLVDR